VAAQAGRSVRTPDASAVTKGNASYFFNECSTPRNDPIYAEESSSPRDFSQERPVGDNRELIILNQKKEIPLLALPDGQCTLRSTLAQLGKWVVIHTSA